MAPHSSTLAWKIPWTEEPGRLQSMGSRRVRHDWATSLLLFTFMHWRRKWQPTPVFLPGESQGQGILVGCLLWGWTQLKWLSSSSKWSQTTLWYSEARLLSIIPPCFLYPISRSVSSKVDWWHKWVTFKGKVNPKGLLTRIVRSTPWYLSTLEANSPTSIKAELRECLKYYHASLVWDYPN